MARETKTIITCDRCKKTDETVKAMVLTGASDGGSRGTLLMPFDKRIGGALVHVGASMHDPLKRDVRESLAADLCSACTKVINETLDTLTSTAAEHG